MVKFGQTIKYRRKFGPERRGAEIKLSRYSYKNYEIDYRDQTKMEFELEFQKIKVGPVDDNIFKVRE